jgi:hypothetical protein
VRVQIDGADQCGIGEVLVDRRLRWTVLVPFPMRLRLALRAEE